ncbi:hypothetical protein MCQ_00246 [Candidatus Bartonella washoeensis Sb944nv]|uniref:Uncharacterized protein n=1 Tax=Candidatus Bartonella washoeensis Sb944nv TaxID=1094563 RepID=J0Z280_9HYPH|nr:hypothetical protein MCQ_00246 [Bartonella washoeensis Sb944nv]
MYILNIINELFLLVCFLSIFIYLFELYYKSKGCNEKNIKIKSLIRIISFFILFFILFSLFKFYINTI